MIKILFVCLGNICRSPMAEFVFKDLAQKNGTADRFYVASAATSREEYGNPVYPPARRILAAHGIDCAGKTARPMTGEDYGRFDWLIGMDKSNLRRMTALAGGDAENKIRLLLSFAGEERDIADPWITGDFDRAYRDIAKGCAGLYNALMKTARPQDAAEREKGV